MEKTPNYPQVCSASIEFTLHLREVHFGSYSGNVQHRIAIMSDGTIYLKEIFVSLMSEQMLNQAISRSFREFSEKFPDDAQAINEYIGKQRSANFSFLAIPAVCITR